MCTINIPLLNIRLRNFQAYIRFTEENAAHHVYREVMEETQGTIQIQGCVLQGKVLTGMCYNIIAYA